MKHLKGMDFPAEKSDIVSFAQHGEGPDTNEVVEILQRLPDRNYKSPREVMKEVGKIE